MRAAGLVGVKRHVFPRLRTYSGNQIQERTREQKYKRGKDCTYYGENGPILVCKLVAEESGKSDILDSTLSGGLCGIVIESVCGGSRDWRNRHSATEDRGTDTTSAGVLSTNVSFDLGPLASGMSSSCAVISTASVSVCDDGGPSRGLNKGAGDGVRRLSIAASEGNEREDRVDEGAPPTSPERCAVLEPTA
jgi:hypothetical protein